MNTLKNAYHNTEARTLLTDTQLDRLSYVIDTRQATRAELSTARRLRDKLCGASDCVCGDIFGRRY